MSAIVLTIEFIYPFQKNGPQKLGFFFPRSMIARFLGGTSFRSLRASLEHSAA